MRPPKVPGRLLAWTSLLAALSASVMANVAYARPELGPRLSAGIAPVLVVLGAGLLERVQLSKAKWWQRWLAIAGLVFVVAASFITSYQHQNALLTDYGNPGLSAVLLPFAVDALIVMASICLAVIAEQRRVLEAETSAVSAPVVPVPTPPAAASTPRPATAEASQVKTLAAAKTSARPRKPRETSKAVRRPIEETRKLIDEAKAAEPTPTHVEIAKTLDISDARVRQVIRATSPASSAAVAANGSSPS